MTALERAEAIAGWVYDRKREPVVFAELAEKIHRAIIEHSNAELERRRVVEARFRKAVDALEEIECGAGQCRSGYSGCDAACKECARRALKALEALDENSKPEPDMRHKRAMQESQEYAKALKALEGDDA